MAFRAAHTTGFDLDLDIVVLKWLDLVFLPFHVAFDRVRVVCHPAHELVVLRCHLDRLILEFLTTSIRYVRVLRKEML